LKKVLTRKQKESYQCILNYTKEHGYPPTVREFGKLIICFFQNQAVGAKWIYPQNPGIAKSNRDFIVRCRHEQSICRCSGRVPERRTAGSHIFYMGGWKKI
jgi:hypothetical protein